MTSFKLAALQLAHGQIKQVRSSQTTPVFHQGQLVCATVLAHQNFYDVLSGFQHCILDGQQIRIPVELLIDSRHT